MAAITALLRIGVGADEIRAIFRQYVIGEKYREQQNRGDAYLGRSIANAIAFLKERESRK